MEDRRESELKTFCSKNILVILGFSSIIAVIALLALGLTQNKPLPENVKFGIVLDAGSSHTSLYIYKWPAEKENDTGVVSQVEECKLKGPGISEFAKKLGEIDIYLEACMERARTVVPKSQHAETPVYLGATAGMRLLRMKNENLASKILSTVAESITRYPFDFQGARIITGQEEGAYGWITINYLLDKFIQKSGWFNLKPRKGDTQETYGALDLGGASTQITFVPQNQVLESPENTLHFRLYGKNYSVYTHSFLCYGKDQALLQKLTKDLKNTNGTIHEPCFHSGYQRRMNVSHLYEAPCTRRFLTSLPFPELEIQGTGDFQKCQQSIRPLFNTSYCPYSRCSFDGVFLPLPQGDFAHNVFKRAVINSSEDHKTLENVMKAKVSQAEKWTYKDKFGFWLTFWIWFLGNLIKAFSAFYYVMGFLNLTSEEGSSQSKVTSTLEAFCSRPWAELQMYFGDVKEKYLSEYCFSGTYILTLLLSGYHFTAETWKNIHFMGKVQSTSVGWTLGYMLNLTNMIPSEEPSSTRLSHSTYVFLMVLFSLILVIVVIIGLFVCHRPSYFWKDMV